MEWKHAPHRGNNKRGKQNTQLELTNVHLPVNDAIKNFVIALKKTRLHLAAYEWKNLIRKIDLTLSDGNICRVS